MTSMITKSTQDLLSRSNFRPVFDADDNLVGISELKVETDRRDGIEAMDELFAAHAELPDAVLPSGFTLRQQQLLQKTAPLAAHYLKGSRKWDAATNEFKPSMTILLPFEVVWHMFEKVFPLQHSVKVKEIVHDNEEVFGASRDMNGIQPDDKPGRAFYTRATVVLTIHLPNGQERDYTGVGVAYSDIPMNKTGNVYAINNARRTSEKGAVSDAKREALSNVAPLFRRAFEDGDEMIDKLQAMIEQNLAEKNKPRIQSAVKADIVPAPTSRAKPEADTTKKEDDQAAPDPAVELPEDDHQSNTFKTVPLHISDDEMMQVATDAYPDLLLDAAMGLETAEQASNFMALNEAGIRDLIEDRSALEEIIAGLKSNDEDSLPDFDLPEAAVSEPEDKGSAATAEDEETFDPVVSLPEKFSGKDALDALTKKFKAAQTLADVEAITSGNKAAFRKLTPKQMTALLKVKDKATQHLQ